MVFTVKEGSASGCARRYRKSKRVLLAGFACSRGAAPAPGRALPCTRQRDQSLWKPALRLINFSQFTALLVAAAVLFGTCCSCGRNDKKHFVMRTYSTFGAADDLAAYSAIINEYTKTHKNVVINDTTTTASGSYKMALSITSTYRGANAPDVIYFSAIKDMSELSDFFMTVDEIRADYPDFARGVSEAVIDSAAANDGGRYCIPVRGDWQGIVVNAALFRKSALRVPETWDDIMKAALHFQKGETYLFANSLSDSSALMEYLVRGLGGVKSVRSAMNGTPDKSWTQALEAVAKLDELGAFPPMAPEAFDYLVSRSDLKNTSDQPQPSPVELYNSGSAAILLIDNTMCGSINTDIDSQYIALPQYGTFTRADITTAANTYPTNAASGPVYPPVTANTLPPTKPTSGGKAPASGSGEAATPAAADNTSQTRTTRAAPVSRTDEQIRSVSENGLYVNFGEGFYITKKAYYDSDKREDMLDFVESFLKEDSCVRLCGNAYRVPALASISRGAQDKLTDKSNIYNGVIQSVQSADTFLLTTQTQENAFFWSHCSMAVSYRSKGILTDEQTLRLIADTQSTAADVKE